MGRPPLRKGDCIEVEVEEEGNIEWRLAHVQKRHSGDDFTAVVCFADGSVDTEFVERYALVSEGVEWRRVTDPDSVPYP